MTSDGPTGREWGDLTRHVEEIRHDLRNMRLVVDGQMELLQDLERRYASLESRIYTTVSVAVVFFGLIGFFINLLV
jgi:hypothetical protein